MFHALHKVDMGACYAKQKINLAYPKCVLSPVVKLHEPVVCTIYRKDMKLQNLSSFIVSCLLSLTLNMFLFGGILSEEK